MKKIFGAQAGFVGKVFNLGRHQVMVEDIIAEGGSGSLASLVKPRLTMTGVL